MIVFIKKYTLLIAMVIGILGYKWIYVLIPFTPLFIFAMLLLTFSKLSFKNLKPTLLHLWLLLIQIIGSIAVYYAVAPFNQVLAQGAMICVLCPTATAAAVVAGKLGGKIETVASYTLFVNIAVAVVAPLLFPLMNSGKETALGTIEILAKIVPLLIFPFLIIVIINKFFPKINDKIKSYSGAAFYIWAFCLIIAISQVTKAFVEEKSGGVTEILLVVASLILCCLQFFFGKTIGSKYDNKIAGGQALGQKNTILAIWLVHQCGFAPLAAVGAGTYIIWQNIINSWQLYKKGKSQASVLKGVLN